MRQWAARVLAFSKSGKGRAARNYASKHELVADHPQRKVIHGNSVVHLAHHFRGHVPWGSAGVLRILRFPDSSNPQVRQADVPVFVQHKVLGFNIL